MRVINEEKLQGVELVKTAGELGLELEQFNNLLNKMEKIGLLKKQGVGDKPESNNVVARLAKKIYDGAGVPVPKTAYPVMGKIIKDNSPVEVMTAINQMIDCGYLVGIKTNAILSTLRNWINNRKGGDKSGRSKQSAGYLKRDVGKDRRPNDGRRVRGGGSQTPGARETGSFKEYDSIVER